jgi:hypothetical protein
MQQVFPVKSNRVLSTALKPVVTIASLIWSVKLAQSGLGFTAFLVVAFSAFSNAAVVFPFLSLCYDHYLGWCRKRRMNGAALLSMAVGMLSVLTIVLATSDAAHAQFFFAAEQYLKNNLKIGDAANTDLQNMITFVFVILRLSFLIYVGVAVVGIIQKGREQEDWISLARTPAIVAGSVAIGDAMSTMIVGKGGA